MFSEPELKTEPAFGFRSVFVTIEVSDVEATPFNPLTLLLTLVTTLSVHAAGNLMNTLVDFTRGVDTPGSSDLTLVKGELLPAQVGKLIADSVTTA